MLVYFRRHGLAVYLRSVVLCEVNGPNESGHSDRSFIVAHIRSKIGSRIDT